ncbi:apolipoprotein N-acyltransferase [Salinibacterium sp. G-O1]|uniref:apolipoprotein N-acyltransferase n=1 Tax=Salinibacterium sp. G-O1 TaxID=3046208 RepID=UPI0024BBCDCF|nr:apolipoprotein N-acyltransferase [Salinibacterium sp. G-O1]MDJ0335044.1 apolipoprotein N-acyltransferase [Salinibacterium sp. G-O1]
MSINLTTRPTVGIFTFEGLRPAPHTRAVLPLWAALVVSAASGPVMDAGFPDKGFWPLTFVGIGLVLVSLIGRRNSSALLVGFVASLAFYLTQISWASLFLGLLPMAALSVLESLFAALGGLAITMAYRWMPRAWPGVLGRFALLPVAVAGLWTGREAWAAVWPYGGFSWGRAAMSQADSPFAQLFGWLGMSGVSFVMVLLVAVTVESLRAVGAPRIARATVPVGVAAALLVVPAWQVSTDGSLRVAAVQGAGKAGYFDGSTANELLQAQLDATVPIFGEQVDVVLWPEGTTYLDPITDRYTGQVFDYVSEQMNAPLIAQGVTNSGDKYFNTVMLWKSGQGALDLYNKKHPVPFGEYVPDRAFWRPFAPDLIDLIGREYTPGTTDMVFDVDGVTVGVNICFDIVDDQLLTDSVDEGARVIFASSNNADFGRTDESAQQLAIARIRAMELGRSVVNISTVGLSAVIAPDGSIVQQLPWYTPGSMVQDVSLSSTITPAVTLGRELEWFVSALGLASIAIAGFTVRRRRG